MSGGGTSTGGEDGSLAPVVSLFGDRHAAPAPPEPRWAPPFGLDEAEGEAIAGVRRVGPERGGENERGSTERHLRKRLSTRQLSVREARAFVEERGLGPEAVEGILDDFVRLGYLDDARLAEQLVHVGLHRKGQGRGAIRRTLAERGIPGDIADAAVACIEDDESERALEFARAKARSMRALDRDAALRRLHGQLSRRGFAGSVALQAARRALEAD